MVITNVVFVKDLACKAVMQLFWNFLKGIVIQKLTSTFVPMTFQRLLPPFFTFKQFCFPLEADSAQLYIPAYDIEMPRLNTFAAFRFVLLTVHVSLSSNSVSLSFRWTCLWKAYQKASIWLRALLVVLFVCAKCANTGIAHPS